MMSGGPNRIYNEFLADMKAWDTIDQSVLPARPIWFSRSALIVLSLEWLAI